MGTSITYGKHPLIEVARDVIGKFPPNEELLVLSFKKTALFAKGKYHNVHLPGLLFEMHLTNVLHSFFNAGLGVCSHTIRNDTLTENFAFRLERNRVTAFRRNNLREVAEYDAITRFVSREEPDFITVWEAKMSRSSYERALSHRRVNRRFLPLVELYGTTTFGYVLFSPIDLAEKVIGQKDTFFLAGGYEITVPVYYDTFVSQVETLCRAYMVWKDE